MSEGNSSIVMDVKTANLILGTDMEMDANTVMNAVAHTLMNEFVDMDMVILLIRGLMMRVFLRHRFLETLTAFLQMLLRGLRLL